MIIDIHTHTFPEKIAASALRAMQRSCQTALFSDGTEEGLMASEARAQVDLAVVQPVATNPEKVSHINDSVLRVNRRWKERKLLSFGAIHPCCGDWEEELERLRREGAVGVKLHPPYEQVDVDDPRTVALLRKCRDLGLIVLVHSGLDVGLPRAAEALPHKLRRALDAVGPMRLIAAHMAGWRCWQDAKKLLSDTGIYLDTSFSLGDMTPAPDCGPQRRADLGRLDQEAFCALAASFGYEHILFGTDSPWEDPQAEVRKIRDLPLAQADIDGILGGNAERLLSQAGFAFGS